MKFSRIFIILCVAGVSLAGVYKLYNKISMAGESVMNLPGIGKFSVPNKFQQPFYDNAPLCKTGKYPYGKAFPGKALVFYGNPRSDLGGNFRAGSMVIITTLDQPASQQTFIIKQYWEDLSECIDVSHFHFFASQGVGDELGIHGEVLKWEPSTSDRYQSLHLGSYGMPNDNRKVTDDASRVLVGLYSNFRDNYQIGFWCHKNVCGSHDIIRDTILNINRTHFDHDNIQH